MMLIRLAQHRVATNFQLVKKKSKYLQKHNKTRYACNGQLGKKKKQKAAILQSNKYNLPRVFAGGKNHKMLNNPLKHY